MCNGTLGSLGCNIFIKLLRSIDLHLGRRGMAADDRQIEIVCNKSMMIGDIDNAIAMFCYYIGRNSFSFGRPQREQHLDQKSLSSSIIIATAAPHVE